MHKSNSGIASALLASTMLATPAAFAQDANKDSNFVEDIIIVEATRRATDIQDIPIAPTAITPVQL